MHYPVGQPTCILQWAFPVHVQGVQDRFNDFVLAAGTCSTACVLGIANYLTGSKLKYVHLIYCLCMLIVMSWLLLLVVITNSDHLWLKVQYKKCSIVPRPSYPSFCLAAVGGGSETVTGVGTWLWEVRKKYSNHIHCTEMCTCILSFACQYV